MRGALRMRTALLSGLCALAASSNVHANIRGPQEDPHDGSSSLYPVTGLTVEREELRFICRLRACDVSATYTLTAQRAQQVKLSFILPDHAQVQVRQSGQTLPARIVESEPLDVREQRSISRAWRKPTPVLRTASFHASLSQGTSQLEIRYTQRSDARELDYGYFSDGRFLYQIRYEVWPLKEWTLAPSFKLAWHVSFERSAAPSLFKRWFGKVDTLQCQDEKGRQLGAALPRAGLRVSFSRELTAAALPERLICRLGPEDLVLERDFAP